MLGPVIARLQGLAAYRDEQPSLRERPAARRPAAAPESPPSGIDRTRESIPLTALTRHATGVVAGVRVAPPDTVAGEVDPALERMALRLMEIGFVEGERLRVVAFGQPDDDPIGVRIGGRGGSSTFALRRQEAGCVWVWPDASER